MVKLQLKLFRVNADIERRNSLHDTFPNKTLYHCAGDMNCKIRSTRSFELFNKTNQQTIKQEHKQKRTQKNVCFKNHI